MSPSTETPESVAKSRAHLPDEERFRVIHSEDVEWRIFPAFPPDARLAVLVGDPTKPAPYVIRVKLAHGVKMLPHRHPEDRVYTVISGVFYIGLGNEFDESKLTAHAPGSVLVLPGGQPHFHWAKVRCLRHPSVGHRAAWSRIPRPHRRPAEQVRNK